MGSSHSVLYSTFRLFSFLLQTLPPVCSFIGHILNLGIFLYFPIWLLCSIHSSLITHLEWLIFGNQTLSNIFCSQNTSSQDWKSGTVEKRRTLASLVEDLVLIPSTIHGFLHLTRLPLWGFRRHQVHVQYTYIHVSNT